MRLFITFVVFLSFASCASHSDTKIVSLNPEKKAESHQRKFSKEEIEHILSIDSDDDPDDILARDVGVCNSRHKLNDFKR